MGMRNRLRGAMLDTRQRLTALALYTTVANPITWADTELVLARRALNDHEEAKEAENTMYLLGAHEEAKAMKLKRKERESGARAGQWERVEV